MHIEELLAAILETNKQILTALQSGAQINAAAAPASDEGEGKKTRGRPRKEEAAAETKTETKHEAKVEAKSDAKVEAKTEAKGDAPTWDEAVKKLREVAQHPDHGSDAVRALIKEIDPNANSVPSLKGKGHEAALLAKCEALLNPAAAPGGDALFG